MRSNEAERREVINSIKTLNHEKVKVISERVKIAIKHENNKAYDDLHHMTSQQFTILVNYILSFMLLDAGL